MNTKDFNDLLLTAKMQADIAAALYRGDKALASLAKSVGARYRYVQDNNLVVGALIFHDHMHIVINGTDDRLDWVLNSYTHYTQFGAYEQVHAGFAKAAKWLVAEINGSDLNTLASSRRVYLGGHSAGGAIAQLIPHALPSISPEAIFTFGSPKVFSNKSAAVYSSNPWRVYRFVMPGDPVPKLPLACIRWLKGLPEYAHTSDPFYLYDEGTIHKGGEGDRMLRLVSAIKQSYAYGLASFAILFKGFQLITSKHSAKRYAAALRQSIKMVAE